MEILVEPPLLAVHSGMFASVRTTRFSYSAAVGCKLSYITRIFPQGDRAKAENLRMIREKYAKPCADMDASRALALARGWLRRASIDVDALDRDSTVDVRPWRIGDKFVPLYFVRWIQPKAAYTGSGQADGEPVAFVELLEPENELRSLRVSKPEYVRRKRLVVPEWEHLLSETDDPEIAKMWRMTSDYRRSALDAMLNSVNRVDMRLGISEDIPLRESSLTEVMLETPFFSRRLGRFGTICSSNYVYSAIAGNKLNYIRRNFRDWDERLYQESLRMRYRNERWKIDKRGAYSMALKWLEDFNVDVSALASRCRYTVTPLELGGKALPLYRVIWTDPKDELVAEVELLEPEHQIELLWVHNINYLRSSPLGPHPIASPPGRVGEDEP